MPSCTRKPALNSKYKLGEVFLTKHKTYSGKFHYAIVFILEAWRVKTTHYRVLSWVQRAYGEGWHPPEISELTEYKLESLFELKHAVERDLGFLAIHGSHISMVEQLLEKGTLVKKMRKHIAHTEKRLDRLKERIAALDKARELLEARYETIDTRSL